MAENWVEKTADCLVAWKAGQLENLSVGCSVYYKVVSLVAPRV